jgi:hypothetical protein
MRGEGRKKGEDRRLGERREDLLSTQQQLNLLQLHQMQLC